MSEIKRKNPAVASKQGKVKSDEVALNIADDNGIENKPDEKKRDRLLQNVLLLFC